jgi:hypothetical protein
VTPPALPCRRDVGGGHKEGDLSDIALLWMVDRARSCGLAFWDDAFAWPGAGGPEVFDGRTFPVDPDPVHDSRRLASRLLPAFRRPIGSTDPGSESTASSAVRRHEDRRAKYAPPQLVRHLRGDRKVTAVPTAGARQDEHALTG